MDRPTPNDAATVIRSRLGLEPVEVRRFLTGLCHHVFSVTTADQQKLVVRIATPQTKRLLAGGVYWNELLRPVPFLDDTTTKNVLVEQGRLTGVVDVEKFVRLKSVFKTLAH